MTTTEINDSNVPDWVKPELFEDLLKQTVDGYRQIKVFKINPGAAAGENYTTMLLRIDIEMELHGEEKTTKSRSYMLKVPLSIEPLDQLKSMYNLFHAELDVYMNIVPEMEQMYRDVGTKVKFGANCYNLKVEHDHILLDNLHVPGFRNVNRLMGLDEKHTKSVLRKLAQWHAASATRIQINSPYAKAYDCGYYTDGYRSTLCKWAESTLESISNCMEVYKCQELYREVIHDLQLTDVIYDAIKVNTDEFNVLNHGDCWSNNIMFQYDSNGQLKETYLIDYQLPKHGSPAFDLYYFLLSSIKYELKISQFDNFIKFYHDNLTANLKLLHYPKELPTLNDIHIALIKHGKIGFVTSISVMAIALMDPNESGNFINYLDNKEYKILLYSNDRYCKHVDLILPWLYYRGALENLS